MRRFIRQPCQICGEQIDDDHEEEHAPENWLDPPWTPLKNVWHAMVMGMDAQMYLVKGEKKILLDWNNHPDYSNSVMYLSYHYEDEQDYQNIEAMLKNDGLDDFFYPNLFMYSAHEVDATIHDIGAKGYRLEFTEN
jgi:hypothetical protein